MKNFVCLLLASGAFATSAPSASAQANATAPEQLDHGWTVWATWGGMGSNNCHVSKSGPDGSDLEFMTSITNRSSMMKVTNEKWTSLRNGETHQIMLSFAPHDFSISVPMESMNVTALFRGLRHDFPGETFSTFSEIAAMQNELRVLRVDGDRQVPVTTFDLAGVQRAIDVLANCVRIRTAELHEREAADPFRN